MNVKEIYDKIHQLGLVGSQVEFSRVWLGRSDRYYSNLIAVRRQPSVETLCGIAWRIETIAVHAGDERRKHLLAIKAELNRMIVHRATFRRKERAAMVGGCLVTF
ncbi:DUF6626 family protein [Aliirhizobium cellulosilyticum]|uniref:Uncharacterized protein n=1 Tax=Aliirhizobium cellulosilyticum TaxID=393664 RepID=A0A7W6XA14_9HYPH|nr:DUF6626 family protein [Rhizobium cellulosilyticum]MBB4347017.1 hypothetical protein [Rhizobium cellulosilyticum]MBB4410589.1 hypothetical protein [Rhizobium cellulosilyticum]MBB4445277.1 hypothetical protein [Rhizobium cellulosilyticum]